MNEMMEKVLTLLGFEHVGDDDDAWVLLTTNNVGDTVEIQTRVIEDHHTGNYHLVLVESAEYELLVDERVESGEYMELSEFILLYGGFEHVKN